MINLANISAWTINIIRLLLIIMIALSLATPVMADVVINGSTTPSWQNTSFDNTTMNGLDTNNIVIGIPSRSADYFNRENSTNLIYWSNPNTWAEINNSMLRMRLAVSSTLIIFQNLSLDAKNYSISLAYKDIDTVTTTSIIYVSFYLDSYSAPTSSPQIELREGSSYIYSGWTNGTYTSPNWYKDIGIDLKNSSYIFSINGTNVSVYQNNVYIGFIDNWGTSAPTNGTVSLSGGNYGNGIYIDNFRVSNTTSGNLTAWHDSGSGNEVYQIDVNASGDTNANYSSFYRTNGTGAWTAIGTPNSTSNQSITLSTKYQNTDVKVELYGNTTLTPELMQITFWTQAVSAGAQPNITSWGNNKTNNVSLSLSVNVSEVVNFNATANQTITTWNWYKDDIDQNINYNNITLNWNSSGNKTVKVNATNSNGTSNTIQWNISISTTGCNAYTFVNVGDSIQTSINNTCATGGDIEIASGTFNISSPINISNAYQNVSLYGQGMDTVINVTTGNTHGIVVNHEYLPDDDPYTGLEYMNVSISNLKIIGNGKATGGEGDGSCISMGEVSNITISNVNVSNCYWGIAFGGAKDYAPYSPGNTIGRNMTIQNSTITQNINGIWSGFWTTATIKNNSVSHSLSWNMGFNAANNNFTVSDNVIDDSGNSGISLYSDSNYGIVRNNTITNAGSEGIKLLGSHDTLVENNTITTTYWSAIRLKNDYPNNGTIIKNNILYGNCLATCITGDGTNGYAIVIDPPNTLPETYTEQITITGNTIFNNGQGGIFSNVNKTTSTIKNNIIVNNSAYGIRAKNGTIILNTYNDIWNNTLGSYDGNTSSGIGDISLNPLFNSTSIFDFHLKSQAGRWNGTGWQNDTVTSPAIDMGDPTSDYSLEPAPNGGRINMGAYGNTIYASKTYTATTYIISVPANSWGMFNNWSKNTNFSSIASNESNDVAFTFYNVTTGEWEQYTPGYSWNADYTINKNYSVLGFFNAQTTITATTVTPWNTSITEGWNMLYLMGTTNQTLTAICTNMVNCTDIYYYNSTTNDYVSTGTDTIQPNQGFIAYVNQTGMWIRTSI